MLGANGYLANLVLIVYLVVRLSYILDSPSQTMGETFLYNHKAISFKIKHTYFINFVYIIKRHRR